MNIRFICLLAVAGIGLGLARNVPACDCVPVEPKTAFETAAAVFVGTVQSVVRVPDDYVSRVSLTVDQAWKTTAAKPATITLTTSISGASCGYTFKEGERHLVYAYGKNDALSTSTCTRSMPLAKADAEIKIPNQIVDGTYTPPPPPPAPAPEPVLRSEVKTDTGLTVALKRLGQSVVAIDTASGKTAWQVQLETPAQYLRVEGQQVIVTPQNWAIDLATGKIISK